MAVHQGANGYSCLERNRGTGSRDLVSVSVTIYPGVNWGNHTDRPLQKFCSSVNLQNASDTRKSQLSRVGGRAQFWAVLERDSAESHDHLAGGQPAVSPALESRTHIAADEPFVLSV